MTGLGGMPCVGGARLAYLWLFDLLDRRFPLQPLCSLLVVARTVALVYSTVWHLGSGRSPASTAPDRYPRWSQREATAVESQLRACASHLSWRPRAWCRATKSAVHQHTTRPSDPRRCVCPHPFSGGPTPWPPARRRGRRRPPPRRTDAPACRRPTPCGGGRRRQAAPLLPPRRGRARPRRGGGGGAQRRRQRPAQRRGCLPM